MKNDEMIMGKFIKLNLNNIPLEETGYKSGDIFIIPPNSNHKITAGGETNSEFYFVRVK
ncbi:MAG: hypothetical protein Q7K55_02010 [Candidatus Levybacteria bacterium]|nr:hypothetical protein [Candidatus Levybacteria bacterium]